MVNTGVLGLRGAVGPSAPAAGLGWRVRPHGKTSGYPMTLFQNLFFQNFFSRHRMAAVALSLACGCVPPSVAAGPMTARVAFGGQEFRVVVAVTPQSQIKGLGGRRSLGPDEGMLFVYDQPGDRAFWMRGMVISIDILWLHNYRVVHIEHNVPPPKPDTPDRELPIYRSPEPGNFVLEIAAGRAAELGITPGSRLVIEFSKP